MWTGSCTSISVIHTHWHNLGQLTIRSHRFYCLGLQYNKAVSHWHLPRVCTCSIRATSVLHAVQRVSLCVMIGIDRRAGAPPSLYLTDDFYQSCRLRDNTPFFIISSGPEQEPYGIMCLKLSADSCLLCIILTGCT